ncbi:hypothetical protein AA313_de0205718 [Arthrobotrys entomopaga]|nr:hypothetical protein AA313_de0205718 [Arthrobotrys entomopaga]
MSGRQNSRPGTNQTGNQYGQQLVSQTNPLVGYQNYYPQVVSLGPQANQFIPMLRYQPIQQPRNPTLQPGYHQNSSQSQYQMDRKEEFDRITSSHYAALQASRNRLGNQTGQQSGLHNRNQSPNVSDWGTGEFLGNHPGNRPGNLPGGPIGHQLGPQIGNFPGNLPLGGTGILPGSYPGYPSFSPGTSTNPQFNSLPHINFIPQGIQPSDAISNALHGYSQAFVDSLSQEEYDAIAPMLDFSRVPEVDLTDEDAPASPNPDWEVLNNAGAPLEISLSDLLAAPNLPTESKLLSPQGLNAQKADERLEQFEDPEAPRNPQKVIYDETKLPETPPRRMSPLQISRLYMNREPGAPFPTPEEIVEHLEREKVESVMAGITKEMDQAREDEEERARLAELKLLPLFPTNDTEGRTFMSKKRKLADAQLLQPSSQGMQHPTGVGGASARLPGIQDPLSQGAKRQISKKISSKQSSEMRK